MSWYEKFSASQMDACAWALANNYSVSIDENTGDLWISGLKSSSVRVEGGTVPLSTVIGNTADDESTTPEPVALLPRTPPYTPVPPPVFTNSLSQVAYALGANEFTGSITYPTDVYVVAGYSPRNNNGTTCEKTKIYDSVAHAPINPATITNPSAVAVLNLQGNYCEYYSTDPSFTIDDHSFNVFPENGAPYWTSRWRYGKGPAQWQSLYYRVLVIEDALGNLDEVMVRSYDAPDVALGVIFPVTYNQYDPATNLISNGVNTPYPYDLAQMAGIIYGVDWYQQSYSYIYQRTGFANQRGTWVVNLPVIEDGITPFTYSDPNHASYAPYAIADYTNDVQDGPDRRYQPYGGYPITHDYNNAYTYKTIRDVLHGINPNSEKKITDIALKTGYVPKIPNLLLGFATSIPSIPATYDAAAAMMGDYPYEIPSSLSVDVAQQWTESWYPVSGDQNIPHIVTNKTFNLTFGRDNTVYVGVFCNEEHVVSTDYDVSKMVLRMTPIDFRVDPQLIVVGGLFSAMSDFLLTYEGGFVAGNAGTVLNNGSFKLFKFVIPAEDMAKFSFLGSEIFMEFGFYNNLATDFSLTASLLTFRQVLFKSIVSKKWVTYFKEPTTDPSPVAIRRSILPHTKAIVQGVTGTPYLTVVNSFNKLDLSNVATPITAIAMGSTTTAINKSTTTRYYGFNISRIDGIKIFRPNTAGNNTVAVYTDFDISVTGYTVRPPYDGNGDRTNTRASHWQNTSVFTGAVTSTTPTGTTLAVDTSFANEKLDQFISFTFAIKFKPTVKLALTSSNTRTVTIQLLSGGVVVKSINAVGIVI